MKAQLTVRVLALSAVLAAALIAAASAQATFPGKNGKIAFSFLPGPTNFGSDDFEIFTIIPGEAPVALPKQNPRKDNWPDWSPDGTKLVWWHQGPAGNFDVWAMNADGSGQTNLTSENPGFDANAAWSPDGTEIVLDSDYQTDTGWGEIQVMDASGTFFRQLTHDGESSFSGWGQFSPDGDRIAFASNRSGRLAIYTMDADDGGDVEKLTPDSMEGYLPDWSPDGERIVFAGFCDLCDPSDVWVMDADGGNLKQLTDTPSENEFRPGWSPNGKKVTFSSMPAPFTGPADIYVMNANGQGRTNITNTPTFNERASDWGPRVQGDDDD